MKKAAKIAMLIVLAIGTFQVNGQVTQSKSDSLHELDQILSPFEDMTEFALDANITGVSKSLSKIEKLEKELVFKKYLANGSTTALHTKINKLSTAIKQRNYSEVAVLATDIFEFNISHFRNANQVKNQLKIEHMDYMGFYILAHLQQKTIDWRSLNSSITVVQNIWQNLSKNLKDPNLKESFNLLFDGLYLSVQTKNSKMAKILASMDLSLVDVLENSF